jgi:hypothetical protein
VSARHLVVVVLDSCRFDAFVEAGLDRLPPGRDRAPLELRELDVASHFNLLMGLLPAPLAKGCLRSEVYRGEYRRFEERLGIDGVSFSAMLPHLWLPSSCRGSGIGTEAASLSVLNRQRRSTARSIATS